MTRHAPILTDYALADRYAAGEGRVFLTGTQALLRLVLDQARRDARAGRDTRGFVTGYRGSPLGGVDQEMTRNRELLEGAGIDFLPAINEEFAATALIGTQQVETDPRRSCAGVFGLWYGKGPGVDRASDALKHGNAYGASPNGGVLVVAGDDHGCVSSSMPHQSDVAFMNFFMPTLHPADVGEFLAFGEYGYALSRFSGMWVGFKAISETVESAMSVELRPDRAFAAPDFAAPEGGLHYRWPDLPGPQIEERMEAKKNAVRAFARANPIDRAEWGHPARFGIVTTGKAHLDMLEALRLLGIDRDRAREIGIDLWKVGMVWPLEHEGALAFAADKEELLVVEEKRGIVESQLKEYFYDFPGQKPARMVGKRDETGARLVPWTGELGPRMLARLLAARLERVFPGLALADPAAAAEARPIEVAAPPRTPYFCSGCPHNTSTRVPEGSEALAGIGCHFMASWMDRNTTSLIQMGGEGVNWVARSRFNGGAHVFQNLGEGTYYHSGSLAIRQAVAAGTNITFKILFNDAVAMTGGQPVDGPVTVEGIAAAVRAEGVAEVVVVSDAPEAFDPADFPRGVEIRHRRELDAVQRRLREVPGTTVLIYQQMCAAEKRRQRKRGTLADPARFAVINPLVCEGCGDCSVASNCLSVEPVETPFGRKRRINLDSCNKDFSCLEGFCPSFVTVEGGRRRRAAPEAKAEALARLLPDLPAPDLPALEDTWDLLVTGVGGTGVVTVGQIVAMAAHLEGRGARVLDFMGFAQKFGPVLSYLRLGPEPDAVHQPRIEAASADALIGCDLVVAASPKAAGTYAHGRTRGVLNTAEMPTGDFTRNRDADLRAAERIRGIEAALGPGGLSTLDAQRLSEALLGDTVYANMMMLGAGWQAGLVPLSEAALKRAIRLNGVKPEANAAAFDWGRVAVAAPDDAVRAAGIEDTRPETLDEMIERRAAFLADYQSGRWAGRYRARLADVRAAEVTAAGAAGPFTEAAAKGLFKLMSYKDEYEVARLHTRTGFVEGLGARFEGDYRVLHHLAPPLLPTGRDSRGRPAKRAFGGWVRGPMRALAALKWLRGTPLDPFGHTAERRTERALIREYETLLDRLRAGLAPETRDRAAEIAAMVMEIRGFGPVKAEAVAATRARIAAAMADWPA